MTTQNYLNFLNALYSITFSNDYFPTYSSLIAHHKVSRSISVVLKKLGWVTEINEGYVYVNTQPTPEDVDTLLIELIKHNKEVKEAKLLKVKTSTRIENPELTIDELVQEKLFCENIKDNIPTSVTLKKYTISVPDFNPIPLSASELANYQKLLSDINEGMKNAELSSIDKEINDTIFKDSVDYMSNTINNEIITKIQFESQIKELKEIISKLENENVIAKDYAKELLNENTELKESLHKLKTEKKSLFKRIFS